MKQIWIPMLGFILLFIISITICYAKKNKLSFDSGPETGRAAPLGRGVNMGNMLEAPNEGEWGETIHRKYFALIKKKGFDTVRIPIRWPAHAAVGPPFTIEDSFFRRVDTVIKWALAQNLNIIINIHHYQEIIDDPDGQKPRYIALWKQIAAHYKDLPESIYFELLNEPNGNMTKDKWNSILADAIAVIRAIDTIPKHTIIIGGVNWNNAQSLYDLQIPADQTKLMATFHFYTPMSFTHQGAEWVQPVFPTGIKWPGENVEWACREIQNELDIARYWSEDHPNIPVLLGEFGAYSKGDSASRANWTAYVRKQAEIRGFSWTYWEFCSGFGVYNNERGQWNKPLLHALGLNP